VALFVAPSGRAARTLDWSLLGLDKEQWEVVHTTFGYLTTAFGLYHLVLNWKVLVNYLQSRARRAYRLRAELVAAPLMTILVVAGSAASISPFSTVMDWKVRRTYLFPFLPVATVLGVVPWTCCREDAR